MAILMLCYLSDAPIACKDNIGASDTCYILDAQIIGI